MTKKHVLVTGPPGIGKTTLCKAICQHLASLGHKVQGFYTEEVRDERGARKGFDVVSLTSGAQPLRRPLARSDNPSAKGPKVGKYTVMVQDFEAIALPSLNRADGSSIIIIDEIG